VFSASTALKASFRHRDLPSFTRPSRWPFYEADKKRGTGSPTLRLCSGQAGQVTRILFLPRKHEDTRFLASRASSSKSFFEASFYKSLFSATRPSVDGRLKLSRLAKLVGRGSNDEFNLNLRFATVLGASPEGFG